MNPAQAAWALLSAVFVICGTIVATANSEDAMPYAVVCLIVGIVGWVILVGMILADRS